MNQSPNRLTGMPFKCTWLASLLLVLLMGSAAGSEIVEAPPEPYVFAVEDLYEALQASQSLEEDAYSQVLAERAERFRRQCLAIERFPASQRERFANTFRFPLWEVRATDIVYEPFSSSGGSGGRCFFIVAHPRGTCEVWASSDGDGNINGIWNFNQCP